MSKLIKGILVPDEDDTYTQLRSKLSSAINIDDLKHRVCRIVNNLGFSDFVFIRVERNWKAASHNGLLYSISDEFMRIYNEEQLYNYDLIIPYAKHNTQPIFASQVYDYLDNAPFEVTLTKKNRTLSQLHKRFRYYDQYFIPMKSANGNGHVQLAILDEGVTPECFQTQVTPVVTQLRCLCKAIDSITTTRFSRTFIEKHGHTVDISPKQLMVLTMLANNDLTISELAKRMCISPITAQQHVAGARKALGVSTNIAAIRKLVRLGLIEFS